MRQMRDAVSSQPWSEESGQVIVRLRVGIVAGPLLLAAVVYMNSAGMLQRQQQAITITVPQIQAPILPNHRVLALAGGSGSSLCDEACIRVLATTDHTIALAYEPFSMKQWVIFTPASGAICSAAENAVLAMKFLKQGYPDKCASKTRATDFGEGLLLRELSVGQYHYAADLPETFHGTVYELRERLSGQDRLLARRVVGAMSSIGPHSLIAFEKPSPRIELGPPLDERQFLAMATKIPPGDLFAKAEPFPLDEVLDGVERYFGRQEIVSQGRLRTIEDHAEYEWWVIASAGGTTDKAALQKHIDRLLASRNKLQLSVALKTLNTIPVIQRTFADDRLFDLVFDPTSAFSSRALALLSVRFRLTQVPPSDELRSRAKARLNDGELSPGQRELLERISTF